MREPPGRAEGLELLRISAGVDTAFVRRGPRGTDGLVLTTFVVRARRLLRSIFRLLDAGEDIEAEVLGRTLMETTVTLLWIASDLDGRLPRWRLTDAVRRVEWDDVYAEASGGDRDASARGPTRWPATWPTWAPTACG